MSKSWVVACVVAGVALSVSAGFGQACPADYPPQSPAEAKIEEALKSPTALEFAETPLTDVVNFLEDAHKIEIQLDRKALDDNGVAHDTPITRNLKAVPLRSALNLVLRELDLTYVVRDDVLLITSREEAEGRQITRVYRVDDLTASPDGFGSKGLKLEELVKTVSSCVCPTTWSPVGGPGVIAGISPGCADLLVVTQDYHVHREIAALLASLREAANAGRESSSPHEASKTPKAK